MKPYALWRRSAASFFAVAALAAAVPLFSVRAQAPAGPDTSEGTTNDDTGTVVSVSPYYAITMNEDRGPFTYRLGQDVHISGPDNRSLQITQVRPGDEATVFWYYRDDRPTVARIVVLKQGAPARK